MHRKKVLSMMLALCLCAQATLPALAGENPDGGRGVHASGRSLIASDSNAGRDQGKGHDSGAGQGDGSPSNAEKTATLSNALKQSMFSITTVSGYGKVELSWDAVADAAGYTVSVSDAEDGTFTKLADLGAGIVTYTHKTGADVKNFYKVTAIKAAGKEESTVAEAEMTGFKALQNNAAIHKVFSAGDQTFDGTRVVNLSEADPAAASILQGMDQGTVIAKVKPASGRENVGILLGLKDDDAAAPADATLSGSSLAGTKSAALLLKTDNHIRYSFSHTRANGKTAIANDQWVTLVFTNAGPDAAKVLRLYTGGVDAGFFSGSNNSGFFSKTNTDTANAAVTIGGFLNPDGTASACFQGEIAYVTVTDELLTDAQAQEISQGAGESEIAGAFNLHDACNSWVITGGRNAQGKYEDIGNVRNYSGLFEEVIRWDMSQNVTNGLQRFVINTAKEGNTAISILKDYDTLIGGYHPKGVAVMLGPEDCEQDAAATADALKGLIDRNLEGQDPVYTVIQLPVPSPDEAENGKTEELVQAVDTMVSQLDSVAARKVVVVDHYHQMKSEDMTKLLNKNGYLNGDGHLEVANQLLRATIGSESAVTAADRSKKPASVPRLSQDAPEVTVGIDFLAVKVPDSETAAEWTYEVMSDGMKITGVMGREGTITKLPEGMGFELTITSKDESVRLPVMAGTLGDGETAFEKGDDRELTQQQQALQDRLDDPAPMKWLFIGDSITHGAAHTKGYDSVAQLFEKYVREELQRPDDVVINTGVSGATTADFMNHKDVRFDQYQDADVVILMFGTNDAKDQIVGTGSFRQNLEEMIDEIRANGAIPVVRTPNKLNLNTGSRGTNLPKYVEIAREAAREKECILADHYELWESNLYAQSYLYIPDAYWNNDDIHPNGLGQLKMARNLWEAMGIDRVNAGLCALDYPVKIPTVSQGIIPPVNTTKTSITVNLSYLQKQAGEGSFGEVTVKAVSGGVTYEKTRRKDSPTELKSVTLENLPTGQEYTVTVEAGLASKAKKVRFQSRKFVLDGTVNDHIPDGMEGLIWEMEELAVDGAQSETMVDLSGDVTSFSALTEGTLHFRFRLADPDQAADAGLQTLFSISDSTQDQIYANFYVRPTSDVVGLEMKNGSSTVSAISEKVNIHNTDWHSAAFVSSEESGVLDVYVDGEKVISTSSSFFLNIPAADTARLGNMRRSRGDYLWAFKGDMNLFQVYDRPLSEDEVATLHEATTLDEKAELPATAMKTDMVDLFYGGYENSSHYRIPSLLTTKNGVVIAAVDQRRSGAGDQGDIATVIRRSFDGGKTWGKVQTLIDLPYGSNYHSFTIDASMLQDQDSGRVFLLVDMFPESTALMSGSSITDQTSGYKEVGGRRYLKLTGANGTAVQGNIYTLRDDGSVYQEKPDGTSVLTDYTVPEHHTGQLYKNGAAAGNIFLYTGSEKGELKVDKTSYLWLISSDDDGATWSAPVCLNGQVKSDWMVFLGTGPGVGHQIENGEHAGRLLFPVYYTNGNGLAGSQSSAVIYSDDGGAVWHMGESPNDGRDGMSTETMNDSSKILTESQVVEVGSEGRLKLFCRNGSGHVMVATSDDGGATWDDVVKPDMQLYDSYCQMSVISYPNEIDGKPAYVFSNPASSGRNDGTVRIGLYDEDTDTFDWKYSQLIHAGRYQYSSVAVMPNGEIGVFYEGDQPNMRFTRMTTDWITAPRYALNGGPAITGVTMEREDGAVLFTITFNRPMMKIGSPVLRLRAGGIEKQAQYVSGSAESEYEFLYTPSEDEKEIEVINVAGVNGSYIGDLHNQMPENVSYRFSLEEEKKSVDDIKNSLDSVLSDENATAEQKKEAVIQAAREIQNLDFEEGNVTQADMDTIASIESAYVWHNPDVLPARVDSDSVFAAVKGAALSVPAGTGKPARAVLSIRDTALPDQLPNDLSPDAKAVEIQLGIEGSNGMISENIQPLAPIEVRFELPDGIEAKNLVVLHYHGEVPERVPVRLEGRYGVMIITSLSKFVIASKAADTPTDPDNPGNPDNPSNPGGSSGSGSSSGHAVTEDARTIHGQWILDETGWWFKQAGGSYPTSRWGLIQGAWYHFDQNGYMQTGWLFDTDRKWYFLKENGTMAANEWIFYSDNWYYVHEDGHMAAAEWILDKGEWYYLTESGAMKK